MAHDPRLVLPITDLSPALPPPPDKRIRGVVTLLWPYSSSTRTCALLLGDPDFRLRSRRGQVRVRFAGPCAVAVAEGRVGIGDHVELGLDGARWVPEDEATARRTPGKSVEGELLFGKRLELRVGVEGGQEGKVMRAQGDEEEEESNRTNGAGGPGDAQTPQRREKETGDWVGGFYGVVPIYSSPAFVRRARLSAEGLLASSSFDPWDAAEYRPRKKPRFSLEGIKSWRYSERSPSPEVAQEGDQTPAQIGLGPEIVVESSTEPELQVPVGEKQDLAGQIQSLGSIPEVITEQTSAKNGIQHTNTTSINHQNTQDLGRSGPMQPPPSSSLQSPSQDPLSSRSSNTVFHGSQSERPSTPKIQPIASETLPLPSPFPNDASHLQLGALHTLLGSHSVALEEFQNAIATESSGQTAQLPPEARSMRPVDVGVGQNPDSEHSAQNIQENLIIESQNRNESALPPQGSQDDDRPGTVNNDEDASILQLTYIQDLSDTEEDDGEMYTKRFTPKTFDTQFLDAAAYQEIEDATEDDADGDSIPATPIREGDSQQNTHFVEEQTAATLTDAQPKASNRETSVEPTASVAQFIRREIARSEWAQRRPNDGPQTPTKGVSRLDENSSADATPKQPTPQSEKDKIMAQTYRSLFGFGDPPENPVFTAQANAVPLAEDHFALAETRRIPDEVLGEVGGALATEQVVAEEYLAPQYIQGMQDASRVVPDLASAEDGHEATEPQSLDEQRSAYDIESKIMQDTEDQPQHQPPSNLETISPTLHRLSDHSLSAQNNDNIFQDLTKLPDIDMSFPSTTAVATDYQSSTEPVSFERMLHPEMSIIPNESLSFVSTHPEPVVDLDFAPSIDTFTEAQTEQTIPTEEPQPVEHNDPAEELSFEEHIEKSTPKPVQLEENAFSESGGLAESAGQGIDDTDEIVDQTSVNQETELAIPVGRRLPTKDNAGEHTISLPPRTTERFPTSADIQLAIVHERSDISADNEESTSQKDSSPVEPTQAARHLSRASVTQQTTHNAPPLSPIQSQEQTDAQASAVNNNLADLRAAILPPTPQLTQGDSLIKGADPEVEPPVPETPRDRRSPESETSPNISHAEHLDQSPTATPLRRSTRTSNKPRLNVSHIAPAPVSESFETSPIAKTPERKPSRKSQPSAEAESISVSTHSVRATPTRRSSRLQSHLEPRDARPKESAMDPVKGNKRTTRSRALSKTLPDVTSENIEDNIATLSRSDDASKQANTSHSLDASPSVTKLLSKPQLSEEASAAIVSEPAFPEHAQKTSARRSTTRKSSGVPEIISHWFSPRRSSRLHPEAESATPSKGSATDKPEVRAGGIATSFSYYTPLSKINEKLNTPSQSAPTDNTIDIIAVVTTDSQTPQRAKSGPRDYYTSFEVTDPSLPYPPPEHVRVEVFRPWHAKLPVASAGDVVLLRAHAVKSQKRQPYLLSTDASAWCVWRHGAEDGGNDAEEARVTTTSKQSKGEASHVASATAVIAREEVKGPPVELGDEERLRARELRDWWVSSGRS